MKNLAISIAAVLALAGCQAAEEPEPVANQFRDTEALIENKAAEIEAKAETLATETEAQLENEIDALRAATGSNTAEGTNQAENVVQE